MRRSYFPKIRASASHGEGSESVCAGDRNGDSTVATNVALPVGKIST